MEIKISPEICSHIANFKVGIIKYQSIKVDMSPQMLKGRLQTFQESKFFDLEDKNITELDGIQEWRQIFKTTGKDPNRYRHSAEALYRRVKKQNYLQPVNSAIDINNFFSLQYEIPLGIYDFSKITGDVAIRPGHEGEEYIGLNGRPNSIHKLIVSSDDISAFGSPFVDSERTAVSFDTTEALQIVYLRPSMEEREAREMVVSLMNMFLHIHGGEAKYDIVRC